MHELVLSLIPGLGLIDLGFEAEGFAVVRGPDLIWGGDIETFHVPSRRFDGVIAGPPCQPFSRLVHMMRANGYAPRHKNLIPEVERVIEEAQPDWWLVEEVPAAPIPSVRGYERVSLLLNNRQVPATPGATVGPVQNRLRRYSFGTRDGRPLPVEMALHESPDWEAAVAADSRPTPVKLAQGRAGTLVTKSTAGGVKRTLGDLLRLQGLPEDWLDECPLTAEGKRQAVANGVPLPSARAVARAIRRAMGLPLLQLEAS